MGRIPKRRRKWGHYLKKGLELGALGAVQFVPGVDVIADAAIAGEAAAGAATAAEAAEVVSGAATAAEAAEGATALKRGANIYNKVSGYYNKASGYYDQYQQYKGYYDQLNDSHRQTAQVSYRGQPPAAAAAAYRQPPKHFLGPLQKKFLIYGTLLMVILIMIAILARHYIRSYHGCSKSI